MQKRPPQHIAVIMDGNGRWAQGRRHARIFGHIRGSKRVRELTEECVRLGVKALTLYTFSTENWNRPALEIDILMRILRRYLREERETILNNNIRFQTIGFKEPIPPDVRAALNEMENLTRDNLGLVLTLALSYGSQQEIADAAKRLAIDVKNGVVDPESINASTFPQYLFTSNLPELDLLIRTGGDHRVSNYLLWQLAYAELYFTTTPWPEFDVKELNLAIEEFHHRERRYGLTSEQVRPAEKKGS